MDRFKNNGSFCKKWRVVLWKVTGRFVKSDDSFCWKWRGIFWKWQVVFENVNRVKVGERRSERMKCKNIYNHILSRVRVRTRSQEFLCFCCHKCHSILCKYLFPNSLRHIFGCILTKREDYAPNSDENNGEKRVFCSIVMQHFRSIFSQRVTLVTAKNQHRCWKARRCAYAWRILLRSFGKVEAANSIHQENRMSLFRDFFSLWGNIDPYTNRGAEKHSPFLLLQR